MAVAGSVASITQREAEDAATPGSPNRSPNRLTDIKRGARSPTSTPSSPLIAHAASFGGRTTLQTSHMTASASVGTLRSSNLPPLLHFGPNHRPSSDHTGKPLTAPVAYGGEPPLMNPRRFSLERAQPHASQGCTRQSIPLHVDVQGGSFNDNALCSPAAELCLNSFQAPGHSPFKSPPKSPCRTAKNPSAGETSRDWLRLVCEAVRSLRALFTSTGGTLRD
eukprot:3562322-Pleurochrysis_carterae.AAC.7